MQAIGVKVQNGYGLTETSPVIAARRPNCNVRNIIEFTLKFMISTCLLITPVIVHVITQNEINRCKRIHCCSVGAKLKVIFKKKFKEL